MGLLLLRWVWRECENEVCWEWVTHHVPARFPQLWGILFININYQLPIIHLGLAGSTNLQAKIPLIISSLKFTAPELLFTLWEVHITHVCVISGWAVVHAGKIV